MAEAAVAFEALETMVQGAFAVAKGIYDPTLPLKATIITLQDISLPRSYHTVSIVKGLAYIFGGKVADEYGTVVY